MKLSGNTILITGGTSGIGLGFAEEFLIRNNKVIVCGRRKNRLEKIKEKYNEIEFFVCDVTDPEQRIQFVKNSVEQFPDLNVLVNNAGIQLPADLSGIDLGKLNREIETNLIAPIHFSSLFVNSIKKGNESAIINISSGLAFAPLAFVPVYSAAKAAIHSYTLSLRHQLRNRSIKVFEIIPPSVDTELGHERRINKDETHGGIAVNEFIHEAFTALESDIFEAAIDGAKNLYEKREALFLYMNK